jgi:uncharacterized protein (DUF302 family)
MNDFKIYSTNKTSKKTINSKEIAETFFKRIKELDSSEQEILLKLYNEITKEMK